MAHGESHAKKTVLLEVQDVKRALSNGSCADPATHGKAILLMLRMIEPIFEARLVTEEECEARCAKRSWGWPKCAAVIGTFAMISGTALKIFG